MESGMPSINEMENHLKIKMVTIRLDECEVVPDTHLTIEFVSDTSRQDVYAPIYKITRPDVGKYIPSKIWHDEEQGFLMLYYVCESLPPQARPFGDENAYAVVLPVPPNDCHVEYDAGVRMLLDQILTPAGMMHFVIFGESAYDQIVISPARNST